MGINLNAKMKMLNGKTALRNQFVNRKNLSIELPERILTIFKIGRKRLIYFAVLVTFWNTL